MRTRSANKNEAFLMLNDDRKSARPQDFDEHGHLIDAARLSANCKPLKQHACGWACSCFLTRLNFLIAGCLIVLVMVLIDEMTDAPSIRETMNSLLNRSVEAV